MNPTDAPPQSYLEVECHSCKAVTVVGEGRGDRALTIQWLLFEFLQKHSGHDLEFSVNPSSPEPELAVPTMDWQQVALNGGPPCFFVEGPQFCGRAERWQGHGNPAFHGFISLDAYVRLMCEKAKSG